MWKQNQPGCSCCDTTCLVTGPFDFEGGSVEDNFSEESGGANITGGKLVLLTGDTVLFANTSSPDASIRIDGDVIIAGTIVGWIIFGQTDDDNFFYAAVRAGSGGFLRLYQRVAGVDNL